MCFLAPNLSALSQISIRIPNSPTAQQHSLKRCPVRRCFGPLTVATDLLHLCGPTTNFRIAPGDQRGPEGASPAQLSGSKITFFIVFSHLESGPECKGIVCILAKSLLNLQGSTFLTGHEKPRTSRKTWHANLARALCQPNLPTLHNMKQTQGDKHAKGNTKPGHLQRLRLEMYLQT